MKKWPERASNNPRLPPLQPRWTLTPGGRSNRARIRERERQESRLKESGECYKKMYVCVCVCEREGKIDWKRWRNELIKKLCGGERKWEWAREIKRMRNAICVCLWGREREREGWCATSILCLSAGTICLGAWWQLLTMWSHHVTRQSFEETTGLSRFTPRPKTRRQKSNNATLTQWLRKWHWARASRGSWILKLLLQELQHIQQGDLLIFVQPLETFRLMNMQFEAFLIFINRKHKLESKNQYWKK